MEKYKDKSPYICISICLNITAQKTKFSIKDFFSRCDQLRRKVFAQCISIRTENLIA